MRKILLTVLCVLFATSAFAAIEFDISPTFGVFGDKRVTGQGTTFSILFDMGDMKAGFLTEEADFTITDEVNAANYFFGIVSMKGVRILREMVSLKDIAYTGVGLDIGSASVTGILGSVAVPAGFNQVTPFVSLCANIVYTPKAMSKVNSCLFLNIGYRLLDIKDVAAPFGGATRKLADLSGWVGSIGAGVEF